MHASQRSNSFNFIFILDNGHRRNIPAISIQGGIRSGRYCQGIEGFILDNGHRRNIPVISIQGGIRSGARRK